MKLLILCCVLLILGHFGDSAAKRGGGSRGGGSRGKSSSGHSSWWSSSSSKKSSSNSKPSSVPVQTQVQPPKASAPKLETKSNAHLQNSGNTQQQPIGWNVPGTNQHGHRGSQQGIHQQHGYQTNSQPWGNNPNGGAWGNNQHGSAWGSNPHGAWGSQQGAWGGGYHPQGGGWGGNQGNWGGYNQHSGYNSWGGGMQRSPVGYGGGYGHAGGFGSGMGGFGAMGGGYGGYGGYSPYEKKRGFFSGGSTFGNILTGMAIYHVSSSLIRGITGVGHNSRPYTVHNYYNQPPETRQEIKLPSNTLSMCEGDLTNVCTGATAICTTNNTVLCVVTMTQATPCNEGKAMCVNTTIPCVDKSDPLCKNTTQEQTSTTVNLPCYTNMSVDVNLLHESGGTKNEYQYCVTTMAVAGPDYKICSEESLLEKYDYRSILAGNYTFNLTVLPMMRKYQVYNQQNPTQAPSGEMVLPLDVLIPCVDNATKLCNADMVTVCTGFGEVMCIKPVAETKYCEDYNTTCFKSEILCQDVIEEDFLCQNKTEELITKEEKKFVHVDMPCFANITINTNLPNFNIETFNGSVPNVAPSSFMYHYHFCLVTMGVPGPETDMCLISDGKEKKP